MRQFIYPIILLLSLPWPVAYGQVAPVSAEDYFKRANTRYNKRDLDGAIADLSKAIELNPRDAAAYYGRGLARGAKGDHDGEIADYTKAIEINPEYANAYAFRGSIRLQQAKDVEAQQDIDAAIKHGRLKPELEARVAKIKRERTPKK